MALIYHIVIKGQFLGLSSLFCPHVRKNSLPIAIRFSGCEHGSGSVYGSGFMETMMQNKIEIENVCDTNTRDLADTTSRRWYLENLPMQSNYRRNLSHRRFLF